MPTTVWPCTRPVHPNRSEPQRQETPQRVFERVLAGRLVAEYSRPHDTVVDLTAPDEGSAIAVPVAAAVLHRRCVTVTARRSRGDRWAALTTALTDTQTDRIVLCTPMPVDVAGDLDRDQPEPAELIVARHPAPGTTAPTHAAGTLCNRALDLLAAGGVLAVILSDPADGQPWVDHATPLITAATERGLRYQQHIIALRVALTAGRLVLPDDPRLPRPAGGLHRVAHTDLLIFG